MQKLQQVVTEGKYSKQGIKDILLQEIDTSLLIQVMECISPVMKGIKTSCIRKLTLENLAVYAILVVLRIKTTELFTVLTGKLARKLTGSAIDNVIVAAQILAYMSDSNLLDLTIRGQYIICSTPLLLNQESITRLDLMEYVPPMVCKPKLVTSKASGHLHIKVPLILGSNSAKETNLNYEFIDNINSIKFSLNEYILAYEEESTDTLLIEASTRTYQYLLNNNNQFYLTHNYDSRGRTYCAGWQVNYQSTDYKKAVICLNKRELICNNLVECNT